jgi:hypothetical protein
MVHLNTKKYSKIEKFSKSQSVSLCNGSVIIVIFWQIANDCSNRYNDSAQSDPTAILSKSL